jgi:hypothetical protein
MCNRFQPSKQAFASYLLKVTLANILQIYYIITLPKYDGIVYAKIINMYDVHKQINCLIFFLNLISFIMVSNEWFYIMDKYTCSSTYLNIRLHVVINYIAYRYIMTGL